jgi:hypothetical protein
MAANDVTIVGPRYGAYDRPAFARSRSAPFDWKTMLGARIWMRGQANMVSAIGSSHCKANLEMNTARRLRRALLRPGPPVARIQRPRQII